MARRKTSLADALIGVASLLPWWGAVALAVAAYGWLHGVAVDPGRMGVLLGEDRARTLAAVLQYGMPLLLLLLAALSAYGRRRRSASSTQMTVSPAGGALNTMSWKEFEAVVAEAFRRKGYSVADKGGTTADLMLRKSGKIFLVHCKQWRAIQVGVNPVRELYGAIVGQGAAGGFLLTSGVFTDEARAFARGRPIKLMDGKALHTLTRGVRLPRRLFRDTLSVMTTGSPFCPVCQSRMVKRKVRSESKADKMIWCCSRYPDCKGTRPL